VEALVVIDLHSHTCTTEIIGLLGGHIYPGSDKSPATLSIEAAQPCRSQATNHQCEMCPSKIFFSADQITLHKNLTVIFLLLQFHKQKAVRSYDRAVLKL
jgi:hypothetical protein